MVTTGVIVMKHPYMTHIQSLMASFRQQWVDNLQSEAMGTTMRRAMPARWKDQPEASQPADFTIRKGLRTLNRGDHNEIAAECLLVETVSTLRNYVNNSFMLMASNNQEQFGVYLPMQWFSKEKTSVANWFMRQHSMMQLLKSAAVLGISFTVMNSPLSPPQASSLRDKIMATNLFEGIESTSSTSTKGRWLLLFLESNQREAVRFVDEELPRICQQSPSFNAQEFPDTPLPRRPQRDRDNDPSIYNSFETAP